jgi:hypothetical protein
LSDERGLVGLLHRADWRRLSMSAEVSDGSAVLIAPGKRYRHQSAEYVTGCDGGRPWELSLDGDDPDGSVHWISGPEPPLPRMLCPAWLLEDSELQVQGRVRACGRDALDVVMTRRAGQRGGPVAADDTSARRRVLVDAELGILLRIAEPGREPEVTELLSADFDPVTDPRLFAPPAGSRIAEGLGESLGGALGPAWWAAKTAAGLAAGALGAWIRYSPSRRAQPAAADGIDLVAAMPGDEPPPDLSPDHVPGGPPVGDDLLSLLHAGGPDQFAATLHQWFGLGGLASSVPAAARRAGFGGLGLLMDAISETPATAHLISRVRVAGQGRYQVDHAYQPRGGPVTIACDGLQRWQVYPDKIIIGPARPLPHDIRQLADPSWLLRCWLSGGTMVPAGSRGTYRLNAGRRQGDDSLALMFPAAVAVVDADMGLVLRMTSYIGANPVQHHEFRDVTTDVGDFRVKIPGDLPTVEESRPFRT